MADQDEFEDVRRDPDPIRRGQRASVLLTQYQQRAAELARLRRAAIEEAHRNLGMSFTDIAGALGLSKGRITQIRGSAPAAERAFFGVGPVAVGVPLRRGMDDRTRTYIDAADVASQANIESALAKLSLAVTQFSIPGDLQELPTGDVVLICGPKSAPVAGDLMLRDPTLGMAKDVDRWYITDARAQTRYGSPMGDQPPTSADIAYVARHREGDRVVVHIAGIHSNGSLGAIHYLTNHLAETWTQVGDAEFSMAIRCSFDDTEVTASNLLTGPYVW